MMHNTAVYRVSGVRYHFAPSTDPAQPSFSIRDRFPPLPPPRLLRCEQAKLHYLVPLVPSIHPSAFLPAAAADTFLIIVKSAQNLVFLHVLGKPLQSLVYRHQCRLHVVIVRLLVAQEGQEDVVPDLLRFAIFFATQSKGIAPVLKHVHGQWRGGRGEGWQRGGVVVSVVLASVRSRGAAN